MENHASESVVNKILLHKNFHPKISIRKIERHQRRRKTESRSTWYVSPEQIASTRIWTQPLAADCLASVFIWTFAKENINSVGHRDRGSCTRFERFGTRPAYRCTRYRNSQVFLRNTRRQFDRQLSNEPIENPLIANPISIHCIQPVSSLFLSGLHFPPAGRFVLPYRYRMSGVRYSGFLCERGLYYFLPLIASPAFIRTRCLIGLYRFIHVSSQLFFYVNCVLDAVYNPSFA